MIIVTILGCLIWYAIGWFLFYQAIMNLNDGVFTYCDLVVSLLAGLLGPIGLFVYLMSLPEEKTKIKWLSRK